MNKEKYYFVVPKDQDNQPDKDGIFSVRVLSGVSPSEYIRREVFGPGAKLSTSYYEVVGASRRESRALRTAERRSQRREAMQRLIEPYISRLVLALDAVHQDTETNPDATQPAIPQIPHRRQVEDVVNVELFGNPNRGTSEEDRLVAQRAAFQPMRQQ